MNSKLIPWLQRIFMVLGWGILLMAAGTMGLCAYYFFVAPPSFGHGSLSQQFGLMTQLKILFESMGQAFFAFLVSSVFGMLQHRKPHREKRTEAFLTLALIGFVGDGLLGIWTWFQTAFLVMPSLDMMGDMKALMLTSYVLGIFPVLMSFVYAITIYVLYKHFAGMLSFESEVI